MKAEIWLHEAMTQLVRAGVPTARLDSLVLLEDATQQDKSYLLAHPELVLDAAMIGQLEKQLERRKNHEPLAYIRGKSEFYGREFLVTPDTLEPRPETETLVDHLKQIINSQKPPLIKDGPLSERGNVNWRVVDVGTGSGCIGITIKLECPDVEVTAVDINDAALAVAQRNAKKLGADVKFYLGDLLHPAISRGRDLANAIIAANLPYVPDSHTINQAAMQEPPIAIFGGPDGLDLYNGLFEQLGVLAQKPAYILTEALPFQHEPLADIADKSGYGLQGSDDFIQVFALSQ
ncbi:MAG TPA: HemK/PrmC family methyltransferase [Candidatus Saccharimonadales bacterium]|nr:HemK/PrmC family methyltransferase [Candidatus Saccharimonadales bacterium]